LAAAYIQWLNAAWVIGVPTTTATDPAGMALAAGRELARFATVRVVLVDDALPQLAAPTASRATTTIPTTRRARIRSVSCG
jgi:hypothetical protein